MDFEEVKELTVKINAGNEEEEVYGTGFLISPTGLVLTCAHVINKNYDDLTNFESYPKISIEGESIELKEFDKEKDIALLYWEGAPKKCVDLNESFSVNRIYDFMSFGYGEREYLFPDGATISGNISGKDEFGKEHLPMLKLTKNSQNIREGFSGSPVFCTETKTIVGMITLKISSNENDDEFGLAIPIEEVIRTYPEIFINSEETFLYQNPFHYGGAVTPSLFYGRHAVLQSIIANISKPSPQSISVVGERRMGKSSLLIYLKNKLVENLPQNSHYLIIYLDLMKGSCHTRKGLMRALRRELTKKWHEPWSKDEDGELESFDFALEELQNDNICLILCLDEVENLAKRPAEFDDLLEDWRANGQMGMMLMITASVQPLADLCTANKLVSPFFNIFSQINLGLLKSEEWKSLISNHIEVNQEDLLFIEKMTGGHPFFTQMAASYLWEMKVNKEVSYELLSQILQQEMKPHLQYLWLQLSPAEQTALLYIIGKSIAKPAMATLNKLTLRGILLNNQLFCQPFVAFINEIAT